jgi:hypothetical protein
MQRKPFTRRLVLEQLENRLPLATNLSFESDIGWTISESDPDGRFSANYTASWSSDGSRSFGFQRSTGLISGGSWIAISQSGVDFTGVESIRFDSRDTGIDVPPLQFLIDGILVGEWSNNGWPGGVGSGRGNTAETVDIEIPVPPQVFTGGHTLTIRVIEGVTYGPGDPKVYLIDHIELVGQEVDIDVLDATSRDLKTIEVKYAIVDSPSREFRFHAYLSTDDKFEKNLDEFLGKVEVTAEEGRSVTLPDDEPHSSELTLDQRIQLQDDKRFVIIVADPDDEISESNEENNAVFTIPLFERNERGFFNPAGNLVKDKTTQDGVVVGPITSRLHDRRGLTDISSIWGPRLTSQNDQLFLPRAIKNEEAWDSPSPAFDGDDAWVAATLSGPLASYAHLVDAAFEADRMPTGAGSVWITESFDREGEHRNDSLHYEGRAIDFGLRGGSADRAKVLERLTGLAFLAGFDFVWNEGKGQRQHVHVAQRSAATSAVTIDSLIDALDFANREGFVNQPAAYQQLREKLLEIRALIGGRHPSELLPKESKAVRIAIKAFIAQVNQQEESFGFDEGFGIKERSSNADTKVKQGLLSYNAKRLLESFGA